MPNVDYQRLIEAYGTDRVLDTIKIRILKENGGWLFGNRYETPSECFEKEKTVSTDTGMKTYAYSFILRGGKILLNYWRQASPGLDFNIASLNNTNDMAQDTIHVKHYSGDIKPEAGTIFVFGSNPEGRHGAGAAYVAQKSFGAVFGVGEGLTGWSYALPTKDLRVKENRSLRSISREQITENIKSMYAVAKENPSLQFKVAYRNAVDETSLNGYTGQEMIQMFLDAAPIPENVWFSEEWFNTGLFKGAVIEHLDKPTERPLGLPKSHSELFTKALEKGVNKWHVIDGYGILALSENLFAIQEIAVNNRGERYQRYYLYNSQGESLHEGFILGKGDDDTLVSPVPSWTISNFGLLSAGLYTTSGATEKLEHLDISSGIVLSEEEATELTLGAARPPVNEQRDKEATDWYESMSFYGRMRAMDNDILQAASVIPTAQGGPSEEEMNRALDDISTNIGGSYFDDLSQEDASALLLDVFNDLPASVQRSIHSAALSLDTQIENRESPTFSFSREVSRSYDVIMVGIGKRTYAEVVKMIPEGTDCIHIINKRKMYKHDGNLNRTRFVKNLKASGVKEVYVNPDWDKDIYSTFSSIKQDIEAGKHVVCIYNESSPSYGITSITVGQELAAHGYEVAWQTMYGNNVSTISHERAILNRIHRAHLAAGKVHQIHFEVDYKKGIDTGKYTVEDGVRLIIPKPTDKRIERWNSDRVFSYNGKKATKPFENELSQMENMSDMVKRGDLVIIIGANRYSALLHSAEIKAGNRGVFIQINPDPQMLRDPDYARLKWAEVWAQAQSNAMWRKVHRELFNPEEMKVVIIGADEFEMSYKRTSLAARQRAYNERTLADNGKEEGVFLMDTPDDYYYQRPANTNNPEEEIEDSYEPTGVSSDDERIFAKNLFEAIRENRSMKDVNELYKNRGLHTPFSDLQLEREQAQLASGANRAGMIRRLGGTVSANIVDENDNIIGRIEHLDLSSHIELDEETVKERQEFYDWKVRNRINAETLHLFKGYTAAQYNERWNEISGQISSPIFLANALKDVVAEGTNPESLSLDELRTIMQTYFPMQSIDRKEELITSFRYYLDFVTASFEDRIAASVQVGLIADNEVDTIREKKDNAILSRRFFNSPELQSAVAAIVNRLKVHTQNDETIIHGYDYINVSTLAETFATIRVENQWEPRYSISPWGANVIKLRDTTFAVQFRKIQLNPETNLYTESFEYVLYDQFGDRVLMDGVIPGKAGDSFIMPDPDWNLENLVETNRELSERYEHIKIPAGVGQVMADPNPGMSSGALAGAQDAGLEYMPVKSSEFTAAMALGRGAAPVAMQVRRGRDNYCRTGLISGRDGRPSYYQMTPNDFDAYLLNPFHIYRPTNYNTVYKETYQGQALQELEAKEVAMSEKKIEVEPTPGLTPVQVLTLRFMGFSNNEVLTMIREADANEKPIVGYIGLAEFASSCNAKYFGRKDINIVESTVKLAYKINHETVENGIAKGENIITAGEESYPAALKAWPGYKDKEGQALLAKSENESIERMPSFLNYIGNLSILDNPTVFVTGSSYAPTNEAIGATRTVSRELVRNDVTIVAVLRNGVDMHAVRTALDRGGRVVLISPRALDNEQDQEIIREVVSKGGCVISEIIPGRRFTEARDKYIQELIGENEDLIYTRRNNEKISRAVVNGFMLDERTLRARHFAAVLAKHLLVVETKEIGDTTDRSVIELTQDAINGVSAIQYRDNKGELAFKHAGNETLINNYNANPISITGDGLDVVIRAAQSMSPSWMEAVAEEEAERNYEIIKGSGPAAKLSTVPFEVIRQGDRQIFVTTIDYVRDAVVTAYGDNTQFAMSREEAMGILNGRPMQLMGVDAPTFKGWNGVQIAGDMPYISRLVYHNDIIYSPTNAPDSAVLDIPKHVREEHYGMLHNVIIPVAKEVVAELNHQNGLKTEENVRYNQGRYVIVTPSGVDVYEGAGETADYDTLIARIYLDSDGLLRVWNADRNLHLDTIQRADDKVFILPGISRTEYSIETARNFAENIRESILLSSRVEREEFALADREKHQEIDNTIESGFRQLDNNNIDKTGYHVTFSIGKNIADGVDNTKPIDRNTVIAKLNVMQHPVLTQLKEAKNQKEALLNGLARMEAERLGIDADEGDKLLDADDNIKSRRLEISVISTRIQELSEAATLFEMQKQMVATAKSVKQADITFGPGDSYRDVNNLDKRLNDIFKALTPELQNQLLTVSSSYQKEDYTLVVFNAISKRARMDIIDDIVEQMRYQADTNSENKQFLFKEIRAFSDFFDIEKKDGKTRHSHLPKEAEKVDSIISKLFSSLSKENQRRILLAKQTECKVDFFKLFFKNADLKTKKTIISFIAIDPASYPKEIVSTCNKLPKKEALAVDGRYLEVTDETVSGEALEKARKELVEITKTVSDRKKTFEESISANEAPGRIVTQEDLNRLRSRRLAKKFEDKRLANGEIVQYEDKILKDGKFVTRDDGIVLPRGVAIASREGYYAYVRANKIVSKWYKEMTHMPNSQRMLVKTKDDKYNVINSMGKEILEKDVDEIRMDSQRVSAIRVGDKWNHVDFKSNGRIICEDWAVQVKDFHEDVAAIQAGEEEGENAGKWAYIKRDGDLLFTSDMWFDSAEDFKDGKAEIIKDGIPCTINKDGNIHEVSLEEENSADNDIEM